MVQCQVIERHAKANNKYMKEYDPSKSSNYLLYVDVNNLYGYAMHLLKEETFRDPIIEFVGLRSKMYSFLTNNDIIVKKAKGIKKNTVNEFGFTDYLITLQTSKTMFSSIYTIQSKKHNVKTLLIYKQSLCSFDDKRCTLENRLMTKGVLSMNLVLQII